MVRKIISYREAKKKIQLAKRNRQTSVYMSGGFDILHVGHIEFLRRAKKLGDLLFVGVESDKWLSLNKGPNRPVNKLSDRMKILSELESVDYVFPTPGIFIAGNLDKANRQRYLELKPNIVAIWMGNPYWKNWKKQVGAAKVLVRTINFQAPISTSKIIQRIGKA